MPEPARTISPRPTRTSMGLVALVHATVLAFFAPTVRAQESAPAPEVLAWFETEVRPLLARRCASCHGAKKQRSGLRTDHVEFLLRGGERGPALAPGDLEGSRMWRAVSHTDPDLQMPPKERLTEAEVAIVRQWIERGAPWPDEPIPAQQQKKPAFDLAERRRFWCWQPPAPVEPPAVRAGGWPAGDLDRFVLARLERAGLAPAPPAAPHTWLRRVHLDLSGLPPSPEEAATFAADPSAKARERVVDALLASPRFGERWARHWLDLVRYAETLGHEFDYPLPNAWRYRDYVIRAFNADVPYDQLVREHVAGDLLSEPRRHPEEGFNESVMGTAFYWFVDQKHSPVDAARDLAAREDNQIDVLSKVFLGITVACARCHDHKFDAISTEDYYAIAGSMRSSRYAQLPIHSTERDRGKLQHLDVLRNQWLAAERAGWPRQATAVERYLRASADARAQGEPDKPDAAATGRVAADRGVDADRLALWIKALSDAAVRKRAEHPLHAWAVLSPLDDAELAAKSEELLGRGEPGEQSKGEAPENEARDDVVFADFRTGGFDDWHRVGDAFGDAPRTAGQTALQTDGTGLRAQVLGAGWAHSGGAARQRQGMLHSATFELERRYIHVRAAGRDSRINVVVDGFNLIRDPIYGRLKKDVRAAEPRWITFDVGMWKGRPAYLQLSDVAPSDLAGKGYAADGYLAVQQIVFSEQRPPPGHRVSTARRLLGNAPLDSRAALAQRYGEVVRRAVSRWVGDPGRLDAAEAALLDWLARHDLLADAAARARVLGRSGAGVRDEFRSVASGLAPVEHVPGMVDGTGEDSAVFVRGNHQEHGARVARRFLEALGGCEQPAIQDGSGRLELAEQIACPDNPLTARVLVNRLWHHLFGRGLVATVDNFGVLGGRPTHPELLDWLAIRLVADGWSMKRMIRRMVLSSTYAMSSRVPAAGTEVAARDDGNLLLHRMRVRRLPGEVIRDAILAVSGRLDGKMFGNSVPIHLTRFMEGRGRPGKSGPVDGAGRRSIYISVRRNFLSQMMQAFDTPQPFTTVGRRNVSNVPSQALALLNDPFVAAQAEHWAKRLLAHELEPRQLVERMYREALSRPPSPEETDAALAFLFEQRHAYGSKVEDLRLWADLAHVLFNLKEFWFVR